MANIEQDGSNAIDDSTRLAAIKELNELDRRIQSLAGHKSKALQRLKNLGMTAAQLKGLNRARAAKQADPEEVIEEQREFARTAALLRLPTEQMGFDLGGYEPDSATEVIVDNQEAFDLGFAAGKHGKPITDSPFNNAPGTEKYVMWRDGWDEGQASIAYRMDGGEQTPPATKRPRSSKKKEEGKDG